MQMQLLLATLGPRCHADVTVAALLPRGDGSTHRTPRSLPWRPTCGAAAGPRIPRRQWGSAPHAASASELTLPSTSRQGPGAAGGSTDGALAAQNSPRPAYEAPDVPTYTLAVSLTLEEYQQAVLESSGSSRQRSTAASTAGGAAAPAAEQQAASAATQQGSVAAMAPLAVSSADLESMALCTHCRYPCFLTGMPTCEAGQYLRDWESDAALKPSGFEATASLRLHGVADAAAVSRGGRANGRWKPDNQDAFLLQHTASPTHAAFTADERMRGADACRTAGAGEGDGRRALSDGGNAAEQAAQPAAAAIGVFDGHGRLGAAAASLARQAVSQCLSAPSLGLWSEQGAVADATGPQGAARLLEHCFAAAQAALEDSGRDFSKSGCTAVLALLDESSLSVAWAGDSRAVLGIIEARTLGDEGHGGPVPGNAGLAASSAAHTDAASLRGGKAVVDCTSSYVGSWAAAPACAAVSLTQDHKPDRPCERERIAAAGGRVAQLGTDRLGRPCGPHRVFVPNCWSPGLALSRALGDTLASSVGVSCTPEIAVLHLPLRSPNHTGNSSATENRPPSNYDLSSGAAASYPAPPAEDRSDPSATDVADVAGHVATADTGASGFAGGQKERSVLIVASDGLWEWVSNAAAVAIAASSDSAEEAAHALVEAAQKQWAVRYRGRNCDDVTVVVAFLDC